jgi:flagellar protein FliS
MNATSRYAQAQNETASPQRVMILLFEAALRHIRAGAEALEEGRSADANTPFTKATDIVVALHSTFDTAQHPELGENLGAVYRFVCQRLLLANLQRDPALAREAEKVFAPVADAFATAVQQLSEGSR